MFKVFLGLAAFLFISTSFSYQAENNYYDYDSADIQDEYDDSNCQTPSKKDLKMFPAYNASSRVNVQGNWDFYLSASFLYWQPIEYALDLGLNMDDTNTSTNGSNIEMDFDFHPAFKVGFGLLSDRDNWNVCLEYTRYYSKDKKNKSTNPASNNTKFIRSPWFRDIDFSTTVYDLFKNLDASWKLQINLLDLEVARPYYVGTELTFRPHVGLRGGWIDQKYNINGTIYRNNDLTDIILKATARNKSDSWLIGPRAGVDTQWLLGSNYRFFGNIAASLFYQYFKTYINQYFPQSNYTDELTVNRNKKEGYLTPNLECALGFGWGTYFFDNRWHFDLITGYEFHIFWNQNMIRSLNDESYFTHQTAVKPGDLMLHGLTITARIDF